MILGIETSTAKGSVATIDSEGNIRETVLTETRNHGRSLATEVSSLIEERASEIEAFAVSIGPGSFTGLRIGLAFLKGLGIVYDRPVVPISSLRVLAATHTSSRNGTYESIVLPIFDARGKEVYAGLYRGTGNSCKVMDELPDGLYTVQDVVERLDGLNVTATGDGLSAVIRSSNNQEIPKNWQYSFTRDGQRVAEEFPLASTLVAIARDELKQGNVVELDTLEPKYHQLSAAEKNQK
ncbi:MAG: tRNA (adenosine(37)-N6)-threonylcarbamoyltransferase complex dimerization subunit type 1 TsaB [Myxococcota bacterium]|nr:tRNA (adenosine(37)-N6)-threonylcarbamoyltransferase complex dimerization subunit type 1 TsaB [Myxococcota bacterium]